MVGQQQPALAFSVAAPAGAETATAMAGAAAFFAQPSRRLYWLCQAAGWLGYTGIYYLSFQGQRGGGSLVYLATYLAFGAEGWLLTHLYRGCIHWRGWLRLPLGALLPRALAANLLLAAALTALIYVNVATAWRLAPPAARPIVAPRSAAFLLGQLADNTFVVALWSTIYFGVHLSARSRRAETERWRLAAALAEAELRGLRAQVNPHFLFNSLNCVRALITEDPARAQEAVTRLAAILRHALRSGASPTVPLGEELEIVEDYLALELIRFQDRLTVQRAIDPATLALPLPPMLVQTLVENAVKHGVSREPGPARIGLTTRRDEARRRWEIEVTNQGRLDPAGHAGANGGGVGLANARERLQRLFGEAARLELTAGPFLGWVTATVCVPLPAPSLREDESPARR